MKRLLFATSLLMFSLPSVQAIETTAPVIVTASRFEESDKTVTQSVTIIPHGEIAKRQYESLPGILRNYGLAVDSYNSNQNLQRLAIRGMRTTIGNDPMQGYVLLLVDGRRVGTDNIAMIPLINVERIEILRGAGAVQYGASAVGGVVNVITKRGVEKFALKTAAGGGSDDNYRATIESGWAEKGFDISGGMSYLTAGSYYYGGGHRYDNSGLDYKAAFSMNAGYSFLDSQRVGVVFQKTQADKMGSPNQLDSRGNAFNKTAFTDRTNYSFDFNYEGKAEPYFLAWQGRYFFGENNYDNHDNTSTSAWFNRFDGAQLQASFAPDFFTLTGGTDWNRNRMSDTSSDSGTSTRYESTSNNLGLFGIAKVSLFDERIILSAGGRFDLFWLNYTSQTRELNHFSPAAGAIVNITDWLAWRVNYARSFRAPTALETLGYQTYLGNSALAPETADSFDTGFAVNYGALTGSATWFSTYYNQKIVIVAQDLSGNNYQYQNLAGTSNLQGLEMAISYDFAELFALTDWSLRPYLNATKMFNYRDPGGKRLQFIADFTAGYGVAIANDRYGFSLDLRVNYYGWQDGSQYNPATDYSSRPTRIGGDTTVDVFVKQVVKKWDNGGRLAVNAEVRNVFDSRYDLISDYAMPGRSFFAGLSYEF